MIDSERARQLTVQVLDGIRLHRAKAVVIDLTGVPAVDSDVANTSDPQSGIVEAEWLLQPAQARREAGAT